MNPLVRFLVPVLQTQLIFRSAISVESRLPLSASPEFFAVLKASEEISSASVATTPEPYTVTLTGRRKKQQPKSSKNQAPVPSSKAPKNQMPSSKSSKNGLPIGRSPKPTKITTKPSVVRPYSLSCLSFSIIVKLTSFTAW